MPYDFDHAGLVDAPYAMPAEELHLSSIHERRYRGYCIQNMSAFDEVFKLYNKKKKKGYTNCLLPVSGWTSDIKKQ